MRGGEGCRALSRFSLPRADLSLPIPQRVDPHAPPTGLSIIVAPARTCWRAQQGGGAPFTQAAGSGPIDHLSGAVRRRAPRLGRTRKIPRQNRPIGVHEAGQDSPCGPRLRSGQPHTRSAGAQPPPHVEARRHTPRSPPTYALWIAPCRRRRAMCGQRLFSMLAAACLARAVVGGGLTPVHASGTRLETPREVTRDGKTTGRSARSRTFAPVLLSSLHSLTPIKGPWDQSRPPIGSPHWASTGGGRWPLVGLRGDRRWEGPHPPFCGSAVGRAPLLPPNSKRRLAVTS